jgi:hypothetical protein
MYFIGWSRPTWPGEYRGLRPAIRATLEVLACGLGPAARSTWPYTGVVVPLLIVLPAAALAAAAWRWRAERLRALDLLLFLAAYASLACCVGWSRAGLGPRIGFALHYALLSAPALCGAYLAWEAYPPRGFAGFLGAMISALACICHLPNLQEAWATGTVRRAIMTSFEEDVRAGMPSWKLTQRPHATVIGLVKEFPQMFPSRVRSLRARNVKPYRQWQLIPVVPLRMQPAELHEVVWNEGAGTATGHDPYLVFRFRKPQYAWGIRLTCTYEGRLDEPASFQAFWKLSSGNDFSERERTTVIRIAEKQRQIIVPIDDVIDRFRIDPDNKPRAFRISRLELLREPDPAVAVLGPR